MVLHGACGVELGQGVARLDLEAVVGAPVVEVVAEAGHHQGEAFNLPEGKRKMKIMI